MRDFGLAQVGLYTISLLPEITFSTFNYRVGSKGCRSHPLREDNWIKVIYVYSEFYACDKASATCFQLIQIFYDKIFKKLLF